MSYRDRMNEFSTASKSSLEASADRQEYVIRRSASKPLPSADWDDLFWSAAETLELTHFRPEGSQHRPPTFARLLYTEHGFIASFKFNDHSVHSTGIIYLVECGKAGWAESFAQP